MKNYVYTNVVFLQIYLIFEVKRLEENIRGNFENGVLYL